MRNRFCTTPESILHDAKPRRTILLTGAAGVVGHALLSRLRDMNVICLIHRQPVIAAHVTCVRGDIAAPNLGLAEDEYRRLAGKVDAVIHCAAVTDFNRRDGSLEATNIAGTQNIQRFAEIAGARIYHISTAFVHTTTDAERGRVAVRYAESKRAGEQGLRDSGLPHVILRPSVVIGDSRTGAIKAFQGIHQVAQAMLSGTVPIIPFEPNWRIDFVPCDFVADAVATVVEQEIECGEFWLTAGAQAISIEQAVRACVDFSAEIGAAIDAPLFVPPELYDRLIKPVFFDALPTSVRKTVDRLVEFFAVYLESDAGMPSSLNELVALGVTPPSDPVESLLTSLRYWAEVTGKVRLVSSVA